MPRLHYADFVIPSLVIRRSSVQRCIRTSRAIQRDFTPENMRLLRCVNETEKWPADFRISETPIFLTARVHARSDPGGEGDRGEHANTGIRAPCGQRHSRQAWRCLTSRRIRIFWSWTLEFARKATARSAVDRIASVPELVRFSIAAPALHAQGLSGDSARLDLVLRRNEGRGLH